MTFLELQDRVRARMNRTSTESRDRIKTFINERLRATQTSTGLGRLRRGTVSLNTTADSSDLTTTGLVKVFAVSQPSLSRVLREVTFNAMRLKDPGFITTGAPLEYAVNSFSATSTGLKLWPKPDAIYALEIDGLLIGTDLSADSDVPAMPEDFHDVLILGAMADEYDHDGDKKMADKMEAKYELRRRELRYFVAKTAYLMTRQATNVDYPWWFVRLV